MKVDVLSADESLITGTIIGAAIEVHQTLGPGLLEAAYDECHAYEFATRELRIERQKGQPLKYKGVNLSHAYKPDFIVERTVIVEVKTVECLNPVHTAQLLTYLKLTDLRIGLLLNFNARTMSAGIRRVVL